MKKIIFIALIKLVVCNTLLGQNQTLYLIFDKNAPKVMRDVRKLRGITNPPTPIWHECGMYKSGEQNYIYSHPIMWGALLWLVKKENAIVQSINLSNNSPLVPQVKNLYPSAMTIEELEQIIQPHFDEDFVNRPKKDLLLVGEVPQQSKTEKFFLDNYNKIFIIELLPNENKANIVPVRFRSKRFGNY